MASAIGLGAFASLIFAGDLAYLAIKNLRRRRALRKPRREYGTLDYLPEHVKATDLFVEAQGKITAATTRSTEIFTKKRELTSQDQADESAAATSRVMRGV